MARVSEVNQQLRRENECLREEIRQLQARLLAPAPEAGEWRQLALPLLPAVVLTDARGYVVRADERARQLGVEPAGSAAARSLPELLPPARLAYSSPPVISDLLARGEPFNYVATPLTEAPDTTWLRVRGQLVSGAVPTQYVCTLQDVTTEMRDQLRLVASETHYRQLIENAPVVLYEWRENLDGSYEWLYASAKLQKVFGISQEDISRLKDYIYPEDVVRWRQTIEESRRLKQPWHFEGRIQVPGQPLRWWRGSAIVSAEDARGLVYQGILEDITPTHVAQQEVKAAESRWRDAMQGVGSDIWELNLRTKSLSLSDKFSALLGYRPQPDGPLNPGGEYTRVLPANQGNARRNLKAYLRGELPLFTATYHVTDDQGQQRWIASRGLVTKRNAAGKPELLTGTHTDVTEITQAKLALEASTRRLTSTVANLQRGVLLEDENGTIVLVNQTFCELFSLSMLPEELNGSSCAALLEQVKPLIRREAVFSQRVAEYRRYRREVYSEVLELRDGRLLEHTTIPLFVDGQYIGRLWKFEDVTKRRLEADSLETPGGKISQHSGEHEHGADGGRPGRPGSVCQRQLL